MTHGTNGSLQRPCDSHGSRGHADMVQKRDGRLIRGGAFTEAEITQYWSLPGCEGGMRASPKTVAQLLEDYPDPGPVYISVNDCELAQKD
eukprot:5030786-Pyramimonas_sp.AAC.1